MNDDELWAAIDTQRLRTADLLETLAPGEWAHRSLCEGWTVRDVAAHLGMQQMSLGAGLRIAVRHPGSMNRMIQVAARDRAAVPTERIIAGIRDTVGSRKHNVGVTALETLVDIVVHGQDIAHPLGRSLPVPADAAAAAASRVWGYQASRSGRWKSKVFRSLPYDGLRLIATDADWRAGEGAELRGPMVSLLLLLTGRRVVLPGLDGPGAVVLSERLAAARV